jgi:hypothetical protein
MGEKKSNGLGKVGAFMAGIAAATAVGGYFLYGPNGKDHRKKVDAWVLKAKGEVLEKIEKTKELNEKKYHAIINQVTKKYGNLKSVGRANAIQLAGELKKHWKQIQKEAEKKGNQTGKKINKVRKKVAKKISPKK